MDIFKEPNNSLIKVALQRLVMVAYLLPLPHLAGCNHTQTQLQQNVSSSTSLFVRDTIKNIPTRFILEQAQHLPFYQTEIIYLTLNTAISQLENTAPHRIILKGIVAKLEPVMTAIQQFRREHPSISLSPHTIEDNPNFFDLPNPVQLQLNLPQIFTPEEMSLIAKTFHTQHRQILNKTIDSNASTNGREVPATGFYTMQELTRLIAILAERRPQLFRQN